MSGQAMALIGLAGVLLTLAAWFAVGRVAKRRMAPAPDDGLEERERRQEEELKKLQASATRIEREARGQQKRMDYLLNEVRLASLKKDGP